MATPCAFNKAATSISNSITRTFTSTATVASPPREPPHPPRPTSSTSSLLSIDDRANASASAQNAFQPKGTVANRMMTRFKDKANSALREKQTQLDFLRNRKISDDYLKQMPRRWAAGDVYSPHDMSSVEMQKWRRRSGRRTDVIDALGIRPLDMYKVRKRLEEIEPKDILTRGWVELFTDSGIHQLGRPNQPPERHPASARQPAQDRQDGPPYPGHGRLSHHPRPS